MHNAVGRTVPAGSFGALANVVQLHEQRSMPQEKTLGQVAFERYSEMKDWKTYDGKPIPPWESLTDDVRIGWEQAALAVQNELIVRQARASTTAQ